MCVYIYIYIYTVMCIYNIYIYIVKFSKPVIPVGGLKTPVGGPTLVQIQVHQRQVGHREV